MVGPLVARARHPGQFHARRWPFFREQFCAVHLARVSKAHQKDSPRFILISFLTIKIRIKTKKEDHEAVYPGQNFYQDWYENGLTITSPTGGIPMIWVDRKPSNKRYGINDRQARETNGDITHRKRPQPKGVANRTASGISAYKEEELKPFLHTCQQTVNVGKGG